MSIKAMSYVWESNIPTASQKLMLLAIADRCDDEGICFPGIKHLAKKCNVSERTASKTLSKLEEIGELVIIIRDGVKTSGGATNRYYLKGYRSSIGIDTIEIGSRSEQLESSTDWEKPIPKTRDEVSEATGGDLSNTTDDEVSEATGGDLSNTTDDSSVNPSGYSSVDSKDSATSAQSVSSVQENQDDSETQNNEYQSKSEDKHPAQDKSTDEPEVDIVKEAEEHLKKPKSERPRDRLYDMIGLVCFELKPEMLSKAGKGTQSRIGKIKKALIALDDEPDTDKLADELWGFKKWYNQIMPNISLPRHEAKLIEHLLKYRQDGTPLNTYYYDNNRPPTPEDYATSDGDDEINMEALEAMLAELRQ